MAEKHDWLQIATTTVLNMRSKIVLDSDGNRYRLTHRDGAADAAALAASKYTSEEAAIAAVCDTLKRFEEPILLTAEVLRTS
jgi:hypothetical protein